ncbi:hypothetical protein NE237_032171 [Protea cynaroides]|uniref:Uncharacterized protein n=1 Tax=Protea cynaroides TaxID=273540 RepID=A0A9Q0L2T9_9MAGN|nr:hypothetical protein NE237_032171 [Protea cynaroides]
MVLLCDSDVIKLFIEVDEFQSQDYTINGFQKGLMTRPSARQLRRLLGRSRIGQKKLPIIINRSASVGRASTSNPRSLKTSNVATITIEGSLRDIGLELGCDNGNTNVTTITDSSNQGCSSNSSASADDTSSRHIEKVILIVWLDDDEGSIHSSEYNGREYGDGFGVGDTEGEGGDVGDTKGEGGGVADIEGDGGGVGEREDEQMEGVGDEVNEIDDVEYDMNYVSDEPLEECDMW